MNDQEQEETRPLVYEDRMCYTEVQRQRQRRRKYFCLALTTLCVGVGLTLAVVLPISMAQGTGEVPIVLKSQLRQHSEEDQEKEALNTTEEYATTETFPTSSLFTSNFTSSSQHSYSDEETSTSHTSTTSAPDPLATCLRVPNGRRGSINLELIEGKMLFELYRIQSGNSPASVSGISCSVMELNFSDGTNATGGRNASSGSMTLNYMESRYSFRIPRTVKVKLEGSSESPTDFTETSEYNMGRLSLLVQLDGFLLTYECFPRFAFDRRPGYVIHLYSLLPSIGDTELAVALLRLANIWGLNPTEESYIEVGHRYCLR